LEGLVCLTFCPLKACRFVLLRCEPPNPIRHCASFYGMFPRMCVQFLKGLVGVPLFKRGFASFSLSPEYVGCVVPNLQITSTERYLCCTVSVLLAGFAGRRRTRRNSLRCKSTPYLRPERPCGGAGMNSPAR
jgi:hypothetical protein